MAAEFTSTAGQRLPKVDGAMHKADINTNLNLSMIALRGSARKWRADFRKEKYQPVVVPRARRGSVALTDDVVQLHVQRR
jgi:hypothetical protein